MLNKILSGVVSLLLVGAAAAEEFRDYYSEPGLNPFKASVSQNDTESIDPFGGTLQLHYTDISIPGNGGLDIKIQRSYTSPQGIPDTGGELGVGWTMHFGRIVVPRTHKDKVCTQSLWSVTTADNPSLEMPDGGRQLLVLNAIDNDNSLITKTNWKVTCTASGFLAQRQDGTKYYISQPVSEGDELSWHTTKIVDKYGNFIDVQYEVASSGRPRISEVTSSDGRVISFTYQNGLLDSIDAGDGQSWSYSYENVNGAVCAGCSSANLTEVIRPDGLRWQYEYNPGFPSDVAGYYGLKKVIYPHGGVTTYGYTFVNFDPASGQQTSAVSTKSNSGRLVELGTWSFQYYPMSVAVSGTWRQLDRTVVTGPDKKEEYIHYGYSYSANAIDALWLVGLLQRKTTYSLTGGILQAEHYLWDKRIISNENFWHGRATSLDNYTYAPVSTRVWTSDDGTLGQFVDYENYDSYGNPGVVRAHSYLTDYPDYVTTTSYVNNVADWRIGVVGEEQVEGVGSIVYELNALDDVKSKNQYGVVTSFDYDPQGNLKSQTDARNKTITFTDYKRGIAQREVQPAGVSIARVVNDAGTVASITNGRGYTRNYTWNSVNELESITYPKNAAVSISYSASGKVLRRGSYLETTLLDGFGRPVQVSRLDESSGETVVINSEYDGAGRLIFESYPNSASGTSYSYDGLGRHTKTTHADGSFSTVAYPDEIAEVVTDEKGNVTEELYVAYGSPGNKRALVRTNIGLNYTILQRDALGNLLRAYQGELNPDDGLVYGRQRSFTYSGQYFLMTETHPEIGVITYTRDAVGNMLSKQVGTQPATTFTYDDLNRLTFVDYPGTTPDVSTDFNANGQVVSVSNNISTTGYVYDENDNLSSETHSIDGVDYVVRYTVNNLDFTTGIEYPSGRNVSFNTDSYGRARQALPFVNAVDYHPSGQIKTLNYANGETTSYGLNSRLFVQSIQTTGSTAAVNLAYDYFPNGDVQRITNALSQSLDLKVKEMSYDTLGRLTQLHSPNSGRTENFVYDALGNILSKQVVGEEGGYSYTYQNGMVLTRMLDPEWKQRWVSYDGYGNVKYLSVTNWDMSQLFYETHMVYDHAGNLISGATREGDTGNSDPSYGGSFTYGYNGQDKKVKERNYSGSVTHYVYGSNGQLLGEYPLNDVAHGKEYVYVGAQLAAAVQENRLPTANPGTAQQVESGTTVTLNGAGSEDVDGNITAYAWTQLSGPAVTLQGATTNRAQFAAPVVTAPETLVFSLSVTDNDDEQAVATVNVVVEPANTPPVANAGADQVVAGGSQVSLDGTGSTDAGGSISTYQWLQTSGPAVTLSNTNSAIASFTAPILSDSTIYGFQLRVTDNKGLSALDTSTVMVKDGVVPITTFSTARRRIKGYVHHQVTLASNEAGTTHFRVSGQATVTAGGVTSADWQVYSGPVTIKLDKKGTATFEYYSIDSAGNQEASQSGVLN